MVTYFTPMITPPTETQIDEVIETLLPITEDIIVEPVAPTTAKQYVTNKILMEHVLESRARGEMTNGLARALILMCDRIARKGNFASYTYIDDMQSFAMVNMVKAWKSFNPDKSNNPFAYFTSCIGNSYKQYLNHERKHRNIRDALLVENGLDPSYTFTDTYNTSPDAPPPPDNADKPINTTT
jgi:hypothetical protein